MNTVAERLRCFAGGNNSTKGRIRQRRAVAQRQVTRKGDIPGLCVLLVVWRDGVVERRKAGETSSCRRVKINLSSLASGQFGYFSIDSGFSRFRSGAVEMRYSLRNSISGG